MWVQTIQAAIDHLRLKLSENTEQYSETVKSASAAPSRMQARYDSSREELSMMAANIQTMTRKHRELLALLESLLKQGRCKEDSRVTIGSLVEYQLGCETDRQLALIVPDLGGTDIQVDAETVCLISSVSPIGASLLGHQCGDSFAFNISGNEVRINITRLENGGG